MERLGILYDQIGSGKLLQAFTPMIGNRLFFELCQRTTDTTYGTANAPADFGHRGVTRAYAPRPSTRTRSAGQYCLTGLV